TRFSRDWSSDVCSSDPKLLEQLIIARLIWTTSQSESVIPSSIERLLVPNEHRSILKSDNSLITCAPPTILVFRESLPPNIINSQFFYSARSNATKGLMVKTVHCTSLGT